MTLLLLQAQGSLLKVELSKGSNWTQNPKSKTVQHAYTHAPLTCPSQKSGLSPWLRTLEMRYIQMFGDQPQLPHTRVEGILSPLWTMQCGTWPCSSCAPRVRLLKSIKSTNPGLSPSNIAKGLKSWGLTVVVNIWARCSMSICRKQEQRENLQHMTPHSTMASWSIWTALCWSVSVHSCTSEDCPEHYGARH